MRSLTALLLLAAIAACNPAESGIITVTVDGLTGADGLLLISEARADEAGLGGYSCIPIDSDPFSASEPIRELIGDTPCDNGDPLPFEPGLYDISTVTMMGGSQTPEACAYAEVEVDGDVEVEMPSLGACD